MDIRPCRTWLQEVGKTHNLMSVWAQIGCRIVEMTYFFNKNKCFYSIGIFNGPCVCLCFVSLIYKTKDCFYINNDFTCTTYAEIIIK